MALRVNLGARGEVDFPIFDGGVFEDCEAEFNTIAEYYAQAKVPPPLGKVAGAFLSVAHRALKDAIPDLTRDEVRRAFKGMPSMIMLGAAIVDSFGLGEEGGGAGEARGPSASM